MMQMAQLFKTRACFTSHPKALYTNWKFEAPSPLSVKPVPTPWPDPERVNNLLSRPLQLQFEQP